VYVQVKFKTLKMDVLGMTIAELAYIPSTTETLSYNQQSQYRNKEDNRKTIHIYSNSKL